jgi:Dam-replacing family/Dam-replacing HTH domain
VVLEILEDLGPRAGVFVFNEQDVFIAPLACEAELEAAHAQWFGKDCNSVPIAIGACGVDDRESPPGSPSNRQDRHCLNRLPRSGVCRVRPTTGRFLRHADEGYRVVKHETTWKGAVRDVLGRVPERFTLDDLRPYHVALGSLFPKNMHVDAKIRQTLQILRDRGELEFLGGGSYRKRRVQPRFSCMLDTSLGDGYTSRSQKARAVIEPWAALNLFCLECPSDDISALPNNAKVADLRCPGCEAMYQVKSSSSRFGGTVQGGDFKTYVAAVEAGAFPNLLLVEWDARFSLVSVVQAIHGDSIGRKNIVPRKALSDAARRAGWQGCILDVSDLRRVDLITPQFRDPKVCRDEWFG